MNFKVLEAGDRPVVDRYFKMYGRIHCDVSFESVYCASAMYRTEWCIYDGMFILRFVSEDKKLTYLQPIGDGDPVDVIPALEKESEPLIICGAMPDFVASMRQRYPFWAFSADRRYADYIYNADDLRWLKGRRYQQKRNHVNKFSSLYNFRYVELTPFLFEDCIALEKSWISRKLAEGEGIPREQLEGELSDELSLIEMAFSHYSELEFYGGAIYVDDRLVAFSFGSPINDEAFCSHIEKADLSYEGAYSAMNNQLALHLPDHFKYIDREWDEGVPGLRKSKLQYHPAFLSDEVIGRKLNDDELRIRDMWLKCFPSDDIAFADSFILNRFHSSASFCRRVDGRIASAAFVIPFGENAYVYACMTDPEYRGRGLFKSVFFETLDYCRSKGFKRVLLIPSDAGIEAWYRKQGFQGRYHISFATLDEFDFGTGEYSLDFGCIMSLDQSPLPSETEVLLVEETSGLLPEQSCI